MNDYSIGTVCKLKNSDVKIIIIGYNGISSSNPSYVFKYIGCIYPNGYTDSSKLCYFNNEHIESIVFNGYDEINNLEQVIPVIKTIPIQAIDEIELQSTKQVDQLQKTTEENKMFYQFDENGMLISYEPVQ